MARQGKLGFTLVELLVVIAIIGLLASIAVVALQSARAEARDAKREADMDAIQNAIELYYHDKGFYPNWWECYDLSGAGLCNSWLTEDVWIQGLISTYITKLPNDPLNTSNPENYMYIYMRHDRSTYEIGSQHYYLYYRLETKPQHDDCPGGLSGWSTRCGGVLP